MSDVFVFVFSAIIFLLMLVYLKIAEKFNIIDQPNQRSSHTRPIIRGGGVIFPIGILLQSLFTSYSYPWFVVALLLISLISFLDDISHVSNKIRLVVHFVAVAFLFYQLQLFDLEWYFILIAFFFVIGIINAVNFMDGINGITGAYALVTLLTLYLLNDSTPFTDANLILCAIIAVIAFNFFNFRKNAKCFAGDVGSVSLAFIIVFFVLQLILKTGNISYVLLFVVYGLDVVSTIVFRLIRGENIFIAHRTHFYQFLANEKRMPHLIVAGIYSLLQLLINLYQIAAPIDSLPFLLLILFILGILIVILRLVFEGYKKLTKSIDINLYKTK